MFESALVLMAALTQLGKFVIGDKPSKQSGGMSNPVKFILSKFGSGKEEDKLAGHISFLKIGPKLLKYISAKKVQNYLRLLEGGGTERECGRHGMSLSRKVPGPDRGGDSSSDRNPQYWLVVSRL